MLIHVAKQGKPSRWLGRPVRKYETTEADVTQYASTSMRTAARRSASACGVADRSSRDRSLLLAASGRTASRPRPSAPAHAADRPGGSPPRSIRMPDRPARIAPRTSFSMSSPTQSTWSRRQAEMTANRLEKQRMRFAVADFRRDHQRINTRLQFGEPLHHSPQTAVEIRADAHRDPRVGQARRAPARRRDNIATSRAD